MRIKFIFLIIAFCQNSAFCQLFKQISCGSEFGIALTDQGDIYSWGFNGNGQLGVNTKGEKFLNAPKRVGKQQNWAFVEAGSLSSYAINTNGELYSWGFNVVGQLGQGIDSVQINHPKKVFGKHKWKSVSSNMHSTYAINTKGELFGWGWNKFNQVKDTAAEIIWTPILLDNNNKWIKVAAGGAHVMALAADSTVWVWGFGGNGQLGIDSLSSALKPTKINNEKWLDIVCGTEFSLALRVDNTLWSWGLNNNGQLGLGDKIQRDTPIQIGSDKDWSFISAGSAFSFAIKQSGSLWGWGGNYSGSLGIGNTYDQNTPVLIDQESWTYISASDGFIYNQTILGGSSLGLKSDKTIICGSGHNYVGQLGNGTVDNSTYFACVTKLPNSIKKADGFNTAIYPNPAKNNININLKNNAQLSIIGIDGKVMLRSYNLIIGQNCIDVSYLKAGSYIVQMLDNNGVQSILLQIE